MKVKVNLLILLFFLLGLSACNFSTTNNGFDITDMDAYKEAHQRYLPWQEINFEEEGFEKKIEQQLGNLYVKKGNKIYFWGENLITGADADSFLPLGFDIAVDKNSIFMDGVKVDDADKETFQLFGYGSMYAKDKDNLYWAWKKIKDVDQESFKVFILRNTKIIGEAGTDMYLDFAVDKNNLYYRDQKYPLPDFKVPMIILGNDPILEKLDNYVSLF